MTRRDAFLFFCLGLATGFTLLSCATAPDMSQRDARALTTTYSNLLKGRQ